MKVGEKGTDLVSFRSKKDSSIADSQSTLLLLSLLVNLRNWPCFDIISGHFRGSHSISRIDISVDRSRRLRALSDQKCIQQTKNLPNQELRFDLEQEVHCHRGWPLQHMFRGCTPLHHQLSGFGLISNPPRFRIQAISRLHGQ